MAGTIACSLSQVPLSTTSNLLHHPSPSKEPITLACVAMGGSEDKDTHTVHRIKTQMPHNTELDEVLR